MGKTNKDAVEAVKQLIGKFAEEGSIVEITIHLSQPDEGLQEALDDLGIEATVISSTSELPNVN